MRIVLICCYRNGGRGLSKTHPAVSGVAPLCCAATTTQLLILSDWSDGVLMAPASETLKYKHTVSYCHSTYVLIHSLTLHTFDLISPVINISLTTSTTLPFKVAASDK